MLSVCGLYIITGSVKDSTYHMCVCVCSFPSFVRTILDVCFVSVVFCSLKVLAFLAPVSGKKCTIFILFLIPYFLCHLKNKQYFQTTLFLEQLSVSSKIQSTEMNMTEEEKVTKTHIFLQ